MISCTSIFLGVSVQYRANVDLWMQHHTLVSMVLCSRTGANLEPRTPDVVDLEACTQNRPACSVTMTGLNLLSNWMVPPIVAPAPVLLSMDVSAGGMGEQQGGSSRVALLAFPGGHRVVRCIPVMRRGMGVVGGECAGPAPSAAAPREQEERKADEEKEACGKILSRRYVAKMSSN
ncbi:hypothetical protein B0H13DRAFT_1879559 [Mycena leptocephala]|nr:hypothetical protein B0H13DRAFT_1879559 [Mycena leptocephala]